MTITPTSGNADHGAHVPSGSPGDHVTEILWLAPTSNERRARELRWTCGCRRTVYTLMTGAGRAWIRRRVRASAAEGDVRYNDTERMLRPQAEEVWANILRGLAR
jgi:hypothetical protein